MTCSDNLPPNIANIANFAIFLSSNFQYFREFDQYIAIYWSIYWSIFPRYWKIL